MTRGIGLPRRRDLIAYTNMSFRYIEARSTNCNACSDNSSESLPSYRQNQSTITCSQTRSTRLLDAESNQRRSNDEKWSPCNYNDLPAHESDVAADRHIELPLSVVTLTLAGTDVGHTEIDSMDRECSMQSTSFNTPIEKERTLSSVAKRSPKHRHTSVGKRPRDFTRPENVKHLTRKGREAAIKLSYMTRSVVKRMREEAFNKGKLQWAIDAGGNRIRLPDELSSSSEETIKSASSNESVDSSLENYDPTDYRPTPSMAFASSVDETPSQKFGFNQVNKPKKYTSVGKKPRDFTRKRNMRHLKISNEAKTELQCVTRAAFAKRRKQELEGK